MMTTDILLADLILFKKEIKERNTNICTNIFLKYKANNLAVTGNAQSLNQPSLRHS